jgi:hypothetical protein
MGNCLGIVKNIISPRAAAPADGPQTEAKAAPAEATPAGGAHVEPIQETTEAANEGEGEQAPVPEIVAAEGTQQHFCLFMQLTPFRRDGRPCSQWRCGGNKDRGQGGRRRCRTSHH